MMNIPWIQGWRETGRGLRRVASQAPGKSFMFFMFLLLTNICFISHLHVNYNNNNDEHTTKSATTTSITVTMTRDDTRTGGIREKRRAGAWDTSVSPAPGTFFYIHLYTILIFFSLHYYYSTIYCNTRTWMDGNLGDEGRDSRRRCVSSPTGRYVLYILHLYTILMVFHSTLLLFTVTQERVGIKEMRGVGTHDADASWAYVVLFLESFLNILI